MRTPLTPEQKAKKSRYDVGYGKANLRQFSLKLNRTTDADLIAFAESVDNFQALIKDLLRDEMERRAAAGEY